VLRTRAPRTTLTNGSMPAACDKSVAPRTATSSSTRANCRRLVHFYFYGKKHNFRPASRTWSIPRGANVRDHWDDLRRLEGIPIGEDEDLQALTGPLFYTACPNTHIA